MVVVRKVKIMVFHSHVHKSPPHWPNVEAGQLPAHLDHIVYGDPSWHLVDDVGVEAHAAEVYPGLAADHVAFYYDAVALSVLCAWFSLSVRCSLVVPVPV